jgi:hypothetical protein
VRAPALVAVTACCLLVATEAAAALFTLTEAQQAEAVRVGERSVTTEVAFDAEWRVQNAAGESLLVITPFYRLALASRNAAFKNEPLKPQDRDKMLLQLQDRVMVWVELHGPREDFARYYAPRLVLDDQEIVPVFVQNERTGQRRTSGSYLARSVYAFPRGETITGQSKVVLVIRDPDGKLVSRFNIELGRMR